MLSDTTLNILLGVSGVGIALLAFAEDMSKVKRLGFVNRLWFKLVVVITATVVGTWATITKDNNSEKQGLVQKIEGDSINRIVVDSSYRKFVSEMTGTLAKYYLMYDSAQGEVARMVRDSVKSITNNYSGDDPDLGIDSVSARIIGNETEFAITTGSAGAASTAFDVRILFVMDDTLIGRFYVASKDSSEYFFSYNDVLSKYGQITNRIFIPSVNIRDLNILIHGTYMNLDRSKRFKIHQLIRYNLTTKTLLKIRPKISEEIFEFAKKKGAIF